VVHVVLYIAQHSNEFDLLLESMESIEEYQETYLVHLVEERTIVKSYRKMQRQLNLLG
jgi:hypothetical protein